MNGVWMLYPPSIPEGDGTMLDNTLIYWGVESGTDHNHSPRDMQYLLIGGKNMGFKTGQFLKNVPASARIILLPAKGAGEADILAREKLCPVVAILPYTSFDDAVAKAKANLLVEGAGHSAALHSNDDAHIRSAGLELPISRLVVNQASSLTAGGSLTNGFAPTTTLGCGSWGGNSISENLDYKHLMNVSRIGKVIKGKHVPTDEEIWAS
jgi:succinate-semialdehyde dehydrogenase